MTYGWIIRDWIDQELYLKTPHNLIVQKFRQTLYHEAVKRTGGNKSRAARLLKMHRNNLDYWLQKEK